MSRRSNLGVRRPLSKRSIKVCSETLEMNNSVSTEKLIMTRYCQHKMIIIILIQIQTQITTITRMTITIQIMTIVIHTTILILVMILQIINTQLYLT